MAGLDQACAPCDKENIVLVVFGLMVACYALLAFSLHSMWSANDPATNFALVRFQSETAVLGSNVQYQMTLSVSNPEEIPQFPGFWSLESYREVDHRLPNGVG